MDSIDTLDQFERIEKEREFSDEENESSDDAERHKKLLDALGVESKLDEKKSKNEQRSEATNDISIFSLKAGSKVKANDLINSLKETVNVNLLKKGISKVEDSNNQLAPLLPKVAADRVERDAAYDATKEKVSRWDDIVKRNRNAEQLSFPLKHENLQLNTVDDYVQKFKPKTPLEQQIYALLKGNKYEERSENGLSVAEEEALKSISIQEARRRRAELQKHRALLSYHEAKNRRLGKIKSRRHLRIIRKQKEKKSTAEFEELQRKDPEKAAEKLKFAEKTRAEERAVLRHRQGSKWAKNRMLMAKYDEMTKVQISDQRKLHSELVQKNVTKIEDSDSEEEEDDMNDSSTLVPPTASMQTIYLPKNNPWLRQERKAEKKGNDENNDTVGNPENQSSETRAYTRSKSAILGLESVTQQKESDHDSSESEEEDLKEVLKEIKDRKKLRKMLEEGSDEEEASLEQQGKADIQEESIKNFKAALQNLRNADKKVVRESESEDDSDGEEEERTTDELDIDTERRQTLEDLEKVLENEEIETLSDLHKTKNLLKSSKKNKKAEKPTKLEHIDPNKVFTIPTENVLSEAPTLVQNEEEGDSPIGEDKNRMTIQEAFADDDVMAEFISEKRKIISDAKPKAEDLTLPGWGEWGGVGLKPSRRRRKKFFIKPRPPPPRKDQHLGPVIINENRDVHIAKHQVNQIPFPFTSDEQYERSIRQPLGKTWNTAATFRKLTEPKVKTVAGAIISPMDEEDAFDDTKPQQRKRVMHDDGNIGFDDVTDTTTKRKWQRKRGNKKHKK